MPLKSSNLWDNVTKFLLCFRLEDNLKFFSHFFFITVLKLYIMQCITTLGEVRCNIIPKDWGSSDSHTLLLFCVSLLPFEILKYSQSISQQEFFYCCDKFCWNFLVWFWTHQLEISPVPSQSQIWFDLVLIWPLSEILKNYVYDEADWEQTI